MAGRCRELGSEVNDKPVEDVSVSTAAGAKRTWR
jgi:hypothetical protein